MQIIKRSSNSNVKSFYRFKLSLFLLVVPIWGLIQIFRFLIRNLDILNVFEVKCAPNNADFNEQS